MTTAPSRTILVDPEGREYDAQYLASGLKAFNSLRWTFEPLNALTGQLDIILLLLEEHPDLQKQVPIYIQSILSTLPANIQEKLICVISTHSPFIVGGVAEFQSHKIYLMSDGSMIDLEMQPIESSSGFASYRCSQVIGHMLGGDVTDLGYPENFILLEEASMQTILQTVKTRGLIRNFTFISASGVTKAASFSETFQELSKINTLLNCNPFYGSRYKVILDNGRNCQPNKSR